MLSKSLAVTINARSACCKRGRKATADHVTENVKDHDVGVFQHVVLLEQFHCLANHITAAARTRRWAASFDAFHAVVASRHVVLGAQFLGMEIDAFEDVDDRGLQSNQSA